VSKVIWPAQCTPDWRAWNWLGPIRREKKEETMKLTIIAATGGVGRQLLRQALDAGHDVTAVARNPANLPQDVLTGRAVRIVAADLTAPDPRVLQDAVAGADAVLSALGPHNNADAGIAAPGTRAITDAMRAAGVRRIVAISASPVATTPYAWAQPVVSWHALVPFPFRVQVSHRTQEPPSEFLPAMPGMQQGASWRSAGAPA